jgi:hypothetical protein
MEVEQWSSAAVLIAGFLNGIAPKSLMKVLMGAYYVPTEINDLLISEARNHLRRLVDQWIESGRKRSEGGGDSPLDRTISWTSPDYATPLFEILNGYVKRGNLRARLRGDGRFFLSMEPSRVKSSDPFPGAREHATYWFVQLLNDPKRERLTRCDACGTYFLRVRTPKKATPIFRGTFCPNCKGKGGVKRMNATRENRTKQMVELASELWPKWRPLRQHGERSKWVAEMMNRKPRTSRALITGKWVTQHRSEIEAEAKRRK